MNDDSFDRGRMTTMEAETPPSASRVVPLSELHSHKIVSGDPDVRGWTVVSVEGETIGQVEDLLVDTAELKVRYLDLALDTAAADGVADAPSSPPENVTADAPVTIGTGIVGTPGLGTYGTVSATGAMAGVAPPESSEDRHVRIPISSVRLAEGEERLIVDDERFYGARRGRR